jgi:hypothetical protein
VKGLEPFNEPDSLVVITHEDGEFVLRFDMLADERTYAEIVHNLSTRVQAAKAEAPVHHTEATEAKPTQSTEPGAGP